MLKKYSLFFLASLFLSTFSSCGFIKLDLNVAAEQFTDFSPEEPTEFEEDCGCYGPKIIGNCTYIGALVCGCDGNTYGNACIARRNGIYIYTRGRCGKPIGSNKPYPIYKPAEVYPSPANPPVVNPVTTNPPEVKPWPANPRPQKNNKTPERGNVTLLPNPKHKRK